MRSPAQVQIFGYPAFAVFGYLIASAAAIYLIVSTLMHDRKDEERAKLKGR